jgi:hypothetical protein
VVRIERFLAPRQPSQQSSKVPKVVPFWHSPSKILATSEMWCLLTWHWTKRVDYCKWSCQGFSHQSNKVKQRWAWIVLGWDSQRMWSLVMPSCNAKTHAVTCFPELDWLICLNMSIWKFSQRWNPRELWKFYPFRANLPYQTQTSWNQFLEICHDLVYRQKPILNGECLLHSETFPRGLPLETV